MEGSRTEAKQYIYHGEVREKKSKRLQKLEQTMETGERLIY